MQGVMQLFAVFVRFLSARGREFIQRDNIEALRQNRLVQFNMYLPEDPDSTADR
jgi:hypothetical protein